MGAPAAASDVFRAVSDPTRRAMLDLLRSGDRSAGELAEPFDMTKPAVSQHLRVLQDAGLVRGHQRGRQRVYRLTPRPLRDVCRWADAYIDVADPAGHAWRIRRAGRLARPAEETMTGSRWLGGLGAFLVAFASQPDAAQDRPAASRPDLAAVVAPSPGPEHDRLAQFAGLWTFDVELRLSPKAAWERTTGRATYRVILGSRFLVEDASVDLRGRRFEWLGLYGFDRRAGKYTAVWADNGDTGMERAEGSIDAAGTIVFAGERPSPGGGSALFTWVLSPGSADRFTIEMRSANGGEEFTNMRMTATRESSPQPEEG